VRTFRYNRTGNLIFGSLFFGAVPAFSLLELAFPGLTGFSLASQTGFFLPRWGWVLIGWLAFLVLLPLGLFPGWKYVLRGYVFKMSEDTLFLDGDAIEKHLLTGNEITAFGRRITANDRVYFFHPAHTSGGELAFRDFIGDDGMGIDNPC